MRIRLAIIGLAYFAASSIAQENGARAAFERAAAAGDQAITAEIARRALDAGGVPAILSGGRRPPPPRTTSLLITSRDLDLDLEDGIEFAAAIPAADAPPSRSGKVIFVGYGVHAPELGRDDLHGVDAHDKTLMFLPGAPAAAGWSEELLRSPAIGLERKIEAAHRAGAAGVMLVHNEEFTGLSFAEFAARIRARREDRTDRGGPFVVTVPWDVARVFCSGDRENMANCEVRAREAKFAAVPLSVVAEMRLKDAAPAAAEYAGDLGYDFRIGEGPAALVVLALSRTAPPDPATGEKTDAGRAELAANLALAFDVVDRLKSAERALVLRVRFAGDPRTSNLDLLVALDQSYDGARAVIHWAPHRFPSAAGQPIEVCSRSDAALVKNVLEAESAFRLVPDAFPAVDIFDDFLPRSPGAREIVLTAGRERRAVPIQAPTETVSHLAADSLASIIRNAISTR